MSLQDAVEILNDQAAGRPLTDNAKLIAAALALETASHGSSDRDLLDAAHGLRTLATGGQLDLDEAGRQRAKDLAAAVCKLADQPSAARLHAGVVITGKRFELSIFPLLDGSRKFSLDVCVLPAVTGYKHPASVIDHEASAIYFKKEEISVKGFYMECLAASDKHLPEFRTGFSLVLDPGMPELIEEWLPRLEHAAAVAAEIINLYQSAGKPAHQEPYNCRLIGEIVAMVLYPARWAPWTLEHALEFRTEDLKDAEGFRAFMRSEEVAGIVRAAVQSKP
jgi:hypothetical protein